LQLIHPNARAVERGSVNPRQSVSTMKCLRV
jgi:hypothetical protein